MVKNKSNLKSPNKINSQCDLLHLDLWVNEELKNLQNKNEREIISIIIKNLDDFVKFPKEAILMWAGCNRSDKYHKYPEELKTKLKDEGIKSLDGRTNGPAVVAYLFAKGERPQRYGSKNKWSIHHIYSGKFPYVNCNNTLHAKKDGLHFTQSAGLIAIHPVADQMCDEYPLFSWYLRAIAYKKFGYDPDEVFSKERHNKYSFIERSKCEVVYR